MKSDRSIRKTLRSNENSLLYVTPVHVSAIPNAGCITEGPTPNGSTCFGKSSNDRKQELLPGIQKSFDGRKVTLHIAVFCQALRNEFVGEIWSPCMRDAMPLYEVEPRERIREDELGLHVDLPATHI